VPVEADADTGRSGVSGRIQWLARRSSRPFERFHTDVDVHPEARTTVVLDRAVDRDQAKQHLASLSGPLRLLALASTDGEDPYDTRIVRTALALHDLIPASELIVAPLGRGSVRYAEKRERIVAEYSRGGQVVDLGRVQAVDDAPGRHREGLVVFFTGLSGSGKSTIARAVRNHLVEQTERTVSLLDGDVVRRHLSGGLGFSPEDRDTNIRRIGWVAAEIAHHGGVAICSPIAPFENTRRDVRAMVEGRGGQFLLVHVATPLEECERRDRKGLYARARRGEIPDFTGISSPYEEPTDADVRFDTTGQEVDDLAEQVLDLAGQRLSVRSGTA
jgi:sulfate adenylyltransferase